MIQNSNSKPNQTFFFFFLLPLKKEKDKKSKDRLKDLEEQLANVSEQYEELQAKWEVEKSTIADVQELREALELARRSLATSEREYELEKVAELK